MQEKANAIKEIVTRLRSIRVEIKEEMAKIEKKARKYDMLRDLTEKDEEDANALYCQQDALEAQLESIDSALSALSDF